MVNKAELQGRLTRDPELRYTGKGVPYCFIRVAVTNEAGGKERTNFHTIVAWEQLAEEASAFRKGDIVHAAGRLEATSWTKDGQRQQMTRVVATSLKKRK